MEKRWPRNTVLPNYRNKAETLEVDKFVEKIVEDETVLYPECGLQKAAVLEIVLKKLREQRRLQKSIPVSQDEIIITSTDSASESSSTGTPTPPLSQLTWPEFGIHPLSTTGGNLSCDGCQSSARRKHFHSH